MTSVRVGNNVEIEVIVYRPVPGQTGKRTRNLNIAYRRQRRRGKQFATATRIISIVSGLGQVRATILSHSCSTLVTAR